MALTSEHTRRGLPAPVARAWDSVRAIPWEDLLWSAVVVVVGVVAGMVASRLTLAAIRRWSARTDNPFDDIVLDRLSAPLGWLLPIGFVELVLPLVALPAGAESWLRHAFGILLIAATAWLLRRCVVVAEQVVIRQFDVEVADNLRARQVHTQMRTVRNIASFSIIVLAVALALMTFEQVRQVGMSLLASAGVAGLIVGFAAQQSIATIIAGVQIAMTQPIRVDDVVIVEGEWGRIEEIQLTYVVVRIWDLRRLVVPITYFIEKPFQNWTRTSADILGAVTLHVDYTIPVKEVRAELERILQGHEKWDGKVANLQVIDATERTMQLRALMSAPDAGTAWDLRCDVREQLIGFIQERYPESLPKVRADFGPDDDPATRLPGKRGAAVTAR